jgi:ABC-type transport system involved in cytochrome c biogenesis permease subunit
MQESLLYTPMPRRHMLEPTPSRSAQMDLITVIAWMMGICMFLGAIGGWGVFIFAWLNDLHSRGALRLPRVRMRLPRMTRDDRRLAR